MIFCRLHAQYQLLKVEATFSWSTESLNDWRQLVQAELWPLGAVEKNGITMVIHEIESKDIRTNKTEKLRKFQSFRDEPECMKSRLLHWKTLYTMHQKALSKSCEQKNKMFNLTRPLPSEYQTDRLPVRQTALIKHSTFLEMKLLSRGLM